MSSEIGTFVFGESKKYLPNLKFFYSDKILKMEKSSDL